MRRAGCLLPAAADLRPAARVPAQRRPALLLQPRVPARTPLRVRLLQVTNPAPDRLMWGWGGFLSSIKLFIYFSTSGYIQVHTLSLFMFFL